MVLIGSMIAAACGWNDDNADATGGSLAEASAFPRTIEHGLGELSLDGPPSRVVALSTAEFTDPLLALGVTPVGATTYGGEEGDGGFPPALTGRVDGIVTVGQNFEANLEQVVALQPDLVVVYTEDPAAQALDGRVPVLGITYDDTWRDILDLLAEALGREAERDQVLAGIDATADVLRDRAEGQSVSIVRPREDGSVLIHHPPHEAALMLEEAGIEVPTFTAESEEWGVGIVEISGERVDDIPGEHLIVIGYDASDPSDPFAGNPLWQTLPAVAAGRVTVVEGTAWTNFGPLAIQRLLQEATDGLAST